ncbi:MAG: YhcH/YjgK/YiaL family protein [Candidatus Omnitrophota bacterium]
MEFHCLKDLKLCTHIPHMQEICQFIETTDCARLAVGEIPLKGKKMFVRVGEYTTEPQAQRRFETHRVYADVQYIVSGVEVIGFTAETSLLPVTKYDAPSDIQFFEPCQRSSQLIVSSGECVIFFPNEAHQPGCLYQSPSKIKKLVFKVEI